MFLNQIANIFYGLVDVVGSLFNFLNTSFEQIIENIIHIDVDLGGLNDISPLYLFFNVGLVFIIGVWLVKLVLGLIFNLN